MAKTSFGQKPISIFTTRANCANNFLNVVFALMGIDANTYTTTGATPACYSRISKS